MRPTSLAKIFERIVPVLRSRPIFGGSGSGSGSDPSKIKRLRLRLLVNCMVENYEFVTSKKILFP